MSNIQFTLRTMPETQSLLACPSGQVRRLRSKNDLNKGKTCIKDYRAAREGSGERGILVGALGWESLKGQLRGTSRHTQYTGREGQFTHSLRRVSLPR